jgi:hypothetical protein
MERLSRHFKLSARSEVEWGVNRFPDGQLQFWMIDPGQPIQLWASLPDSECLDLFFQMIAAVPFEGVQINYLYGARSDKDRAGDRTVCNVAKLVLDRVRHLDGCTIVSPHCGQDLLQEVGSIFPIHPEILANEPSYDLILFPDASAERRFAGRIPGIPTLTCVKERDQVTGQIIRHEAPPIPAGQTVLVVDDLCDGGRTFLEVADFIPDSKKRDLYVTHGVFSGNAVERLLGAYDRIWVSNSLPSAIAAADASDRVRVLDVWGPE